MIETRRFHAGDIAIIGPQASELGARKYADPATDWSPLASSPWSWTFCVNDKPAACGGWVACGLGGAWAWALVGHVPKAAVVPFVRAYGRKLDVTPFDWVEAHVEPGFETSIRWLLLLGFEPVSGNVKVGPDRTEFLRMVYRKGGTQ